MSTHKRKQININLLDINYENPRFESATSQREAILKMVEDQKLKSGQNKLLNIAKHILAHGLNPSDPPLVSPSQDEAKHFTILEGNRRITALKLLMTPSIIEKEHKGLSDRFKKLAEKQNLSIFDKVEVLVFDNADDAKLWIELKHTGQNDGVGVVEWNYQQQQRYKGNSSSIEIIDYIKNSENISTETKHKLESVKITNLERLLHDPKIKSFLGLKTKNGKFYSNFDPVELDKGLEEIIGRITHRDFKVTKIYYKGDREKFLSNIPKRSWPKTNKVEEWEIANPPSEPKATAEKNKKKPIKKDDPKSTDRSSLIPKACKFNITESKPNNMFMELKQLTIDDFPNAVGVLFRVFLELSTDHYIKIKGIPTRESDRLKDKIKKVCNYMSEKSILSDDELLGAREIASNDTSFLSVNTFHAYVHNINFSSSPLDMKIKWDNLQNFLFKIWE